MMRCPWLVEVEAGRVALRQLVLSPVRYASLEVDLAGASERGDLDLALARTLDACCREVAALGTVEALVLEVSLVGRTRLPASALRVAAVEDRCRPAVELERHAGDGSPLALLAARLAELERGEAGDLVDRLRRGARRVGESSAYLGIVPDLEARLSPERLRERLERVGGRALEVLLAQHEAGTEDDDGPPEEGGEA